MQLCQLNLEFVFLSDSREKHSINIGSWQIVGSTQNTTNLTSFLMCLDRPHKFLHGSVCKFHTNLCNKLDDLDKNIQGHVPGHNATTPFGEQGGGNGCQTTVGRRRQDNRQETQAKRKEKVLSLLDCHLTTE